MKDCPEDVDVHAVTCETGGDEEVTVRLVDRETPDLKLKVHSDPEHTLASQPKDELFLAKTMDASKFGGSYKDYEMIQPSMIVVDSQGKVEQAWSWKVMDVKLPAGTELVNAEMVKTDEDGDKATTGGEVPLVTVRPDSDDIFASIKEGRDCKFDQKMGLFELLGDFAQDQIKQSCCFCCLPSKNKIKPATKTAAERNADHNDRYEENLLAAARLLATRKK